MMENSNPQPEISSQSDVLAKIFPWAVIAAVLSAISAIGCVAWCLNKM
jgi:hypothetical protein